MERSDIFRALAMIALIGVFLMALAAINRRPAEPAITPAPSAPGPNHLSAELRRCNELGPQDAEDARCAAVWEENRRRFFGRPARPLPPPNTQERSAAPAPSNKKDAASGDAR